MDIVGGLVAVHDLKFLVGLQRQHVRPVLAAFLLKRSWLLRRLESCEY